MGLTDGLAEALKRHWGYNSFRPLQREAMESVVAGKDSVVVLPTGGGKSLCFQAPAVVMPGMAVVVSPLISLMKDQVDALAECGVPAARIDSSLAPDEKRETVARIRRGELKLLYAAPERLVSDGFAGLLEGVRVSFIAVDEAHCVSMWGHDFRPEYRRLGGLKDAFCGVGVHAYTATATPQVRDDVAEQLRLERPRVLVGTFDRPNLSFRVERAAGRIEQVLAVLARHAGESGIVYCVTRRGVDETCATLSAKGHRAVPYHAGMSDSDRKRSQDAFIRDEADIVVATVAFGMGIDKPDVRFVVHAGMPRSLEHYQQESGRAGRDGLEAECHLLYSGQDYAFWRRIVDEMPEEARRIAAGKLNDMWSYCTGVVCRHRSIARYFGQDLAGDRCEACDVCAGGLDCVDDGLVIAQKILSCVVRLDERFGADYTASVLAGSREARILENRHDRLSTYGLLAEEGKRAARDWTEQLVAQGHIQKAGEYGVLCVTASGRRVLKGEETPRLLKRPDRAPVKSGRKRAPAPEPPQGPSDRGLAERLRALRREIASSRRVPAYIVFGDVTLRDLARRKPATREALLEVHGIGTARMEQYGEAILSAIRGHAEGGAP